MNNCPVCRSTKYNTRTIGKSIISGYVCSEKNESLDQPIFEMLLNLCENCSTLFQNKYKDGDEILNRMYTQHEATIRNSDLYVSYYNQFANKIAEDLNSNSKEAKILEIGCNDGLLLDLIGSKCKSKIFGFEPSVKFKDIWRARKIIGVNDFFNVESARELIQKFGRMDVIIARHVLEHIANPHDFFEGLQLISNADTTIFIEVPYLTSIFQLNRFENVSYSHLVHYSVKSMKNLSQHYGFVVEDYNLCDIDGGSVVFKLKHSMARNVCSVETPVAEVNLNILFEKFISDFEASKMHLSCYIKNHENGNFVGFGAGAKGQFLIHLYGLQNLLTAVIDETPGYAGKYIPGTAIPIVDLDYLHDIKSASVINLAPTHTSAVMKKIPKEFLFIDPVNKIYPDI